MKIIKQHYLYILVVGAWLGYLLLSITAPSGDAQRFSISETQVDLLQATIAMPALFIWLVAARSTKKLFTYTSLIADSTDGKAMRFIAYGVALIFALIVAQFSLGSAVPFFKDSPLLPAAVFIHNHIPAALALTGFGLLYYGSVKLKALLPVNIKPYDLLWLLIPYLTFSIFFAQQMYNRLEQHIVVNGVPNFALPGRLPLFTLTLPYLIAWFLGLSAAKNMIDFTRDVRGSIYRKPLITFITGLMIVLGNAILLQLLVVNAKIATTENLAIILGFVYFLLFVYILGFIWLHKGTKQLLALEGVGSKKTSD